MCSTLLLQFWARMTATYKYMIELTFITAHQADATTGVLKPQCGTALWAVRNVARYREGALAHVADAYAVAQLENPVMAVTLPMLTTGRPPGKTYGLHVPHGLFIPSLALSLGGRRANWWDHARIKGQGKGWDRDWGWDWGWGQGD